MATLVRFIIRCTVTILSWVLIFALLFLTGVTEDQPFLVSIVFIVAMAKMLTHVEISLTSLVEQYLKISDGNYVVSAKLVTSQTNLVQMVKTAARKHGGRVESLFGASAFGAHVTINLEFQRAESAGSFCTFLMEHKIIFDVDC